MDDKVTRDSEGDESPVELNNGDTRNNYLFDPVTYPDWFWRQGLRVADLLILVDRGQTENVAREIFKQHKNVVFTSLRVNAIANLFAHIYYDD